MREEWPVASMNGREQSGSPVRTAGISAVSATHFVARDGLEVAARSGIEVVDVVCIPSGRVMVHAAGSSRIGC